MSKYMYYPGCAMKERGGECERSLLAAIQALGIELEELADWNCCGASGYTSLGDAQSFAMVARNLALAEGAGEMDLLTPCGACHRVLNKTQHHMGMYPDVRNQVCAALAGGGLAYRGTLGVRHVLDVFIEGEGERVISEGVTNPLSGLKVAPYYGCQYDLPIVASEAETEPGPLERLLTALGADVIDHPSMTQCCGGVHLMQRYQTPPQTVETLIQEAQQLGADVIATICPACQFNLERSQERLRDTFGVPSTSIVYFAKLVGTALGLPDSQLGVRQGAKPAD